jgi:DNA polymerase/3'-5' exonuclease PolX
MELKQANEIANRLATELSPGCERIAVAGSVRRGKADVKDLEIVAIPKIVTVADLFGTPTNSYSMLDAELHRLGLHLIKGGEKYKQFLLPEGINLDLFITTPEQWGWIFVLRTGHRDFNKWLVTPRRHGGALPSYIKPRDGWITNGNGSVRTPEESDVFRVLGVEWLEPALRCTEHREMWKLVN